MADFEDSAARYEGNPNPTSFQMISISNMNLLDDQRYERRDRSASPRGDRDDRNRSRSPNGRERPSVQSRL